LEKRGKKMNKFIICFSVIVLYVRAGFSPYFLTNNCATVVNFESVKTPVAGNDEVKKIGWLSFYHESTYIHNGVRASYEMNVATREERSALYNLRIVNRTNSNSLMFIGTTDKDGNFGCTLTDASFDEDLLSPYYKYLVDNFNYETSNSSDVFKGKSCTSYVNSKGTTIYALTDRVIGLKIVAEDYTEVVSFSYEYTIYYYYLFMNPKYDVDMCSDYSSAFREPNVAFLRCGTNPEYETVKVGELPCLYRANLNLTTVLDDQVNITTGFEARYGRTMVTYKDGYDSLEEVEGKITRFLKVDEDDYCQLYTSIDKSSCGSKHPYSIESAYEQLSDFYQYTTKELSYSFKDEGRMFNGVATTSYFLETGLNGQVTLFLNEDKYIVGMIHVRESNGPVDTYVYSYDMEPSFKTFSIPKDSICNSSHNIPYPKEPDCHLSPIDKSSSSDSKPNASSTNMLSLAVVITMIMAIICSLH